jgi:hypothetical protein
MNKDPANGKDTIYIDVDDEITGIIEKVQNSQQRIVALVLPKRATMLQSVVNMKLLRRAGEKAKRHIVLITGEAGLMPLAGSVGLHVAKSLQSKPEVPTAPQPADDDKAETAADDPAADKSRSVGELAGDDDDEAPIELDNADDGEETPAGGKKDKDKKGKKFKIPNFNKFRTWIVIGGLGLLLLIGGLVWALTALPRAEIVITTDSEAIVSSREIMLLTDRNAALDADEGIVPAQAEEITRTQRAEVDATGEENQGKKASGSVIMTTQVCAPNLGDPPDDVPAGTGVSTDGKTYITQESTDFSFDGGAGNCINYKSSPVDITAQKGGKSYNVKNEEFSVAGRSDVSAEGSTSGGTNKIVQVVTQADIDKARERIEERESDGIEQELQEALADAGLFPVTETFSISTADTQTSAEAGEEADSVTVTEEVTYTMLGVQEEDLERVVTADVADDIDPERQTILDYGFTEASFTLQNQQDGGALVGLRTVVVAGPDLDAETIKGDIAGKKASEAREIIGVNPGVTDIEVTYGPFWVRSIPKNTDKITIIVEEPEAVPDENTNEEDTAENQDADE